MSYTGKDYNETTTFTGEGHLEKLLFDIDAIDELLENECEISDDLDNELAVDRMEKEEMAIYSLAYDMRELCVVCSISEQEAALEYDESVESVMSLKEFRQVSLNAAYHIYAKLTTVLAIEIAIEYKEKDYEYFEIGDFHEVMERTRLNMEKVAYITVLKSEFDRVTNNIFFSKDIANLVKFRAGKRKGALKTNSKYSEAKKIALKYASEIWDDDVTKRKGVVADEVLSKLYELNESSGKKLFSDAPTLGTIKKWISGVAKEGASRPGRPKKQ